MNARKVVLIANQDKENLGVGYLTSFLLSKGYAVDIIDFSETVSAIYERTAIADPILVGFSLIFQYYSDRLRELCRYLRQKGITCHFTVGGHYPSLRYGDILEYIPELDSVIRFEGEHSLFELLEALSTDTDWRRIPSLAFRSKGKPVATKLRSLIKDLDALPFPYRVNSDLYQCMGVNYLTMLASRGCVHNCSFCSIRRFYGTPPGKLRRARSPENVVLEMQTLYNTYATRIFLFQDDDFLLPGRKGAEWIHDFISHLKTTGIADHILWKISCRTDEVEYQLVQSLQEVGLFLTYLGIESGNQTSLNTLNKQLTVSDHLQAVDTLNRLGISYEMGFMLFDPSSTFDSVRENLTFLQRICGDGSTPIVFCKTIPYAETDIEQMLLKQGRMKGSIISPDYDLGDWRLESYCRFLHTMFEEWMFTNNGLMAKLRWHRFELAVLKKFYPSIQNLDTYSRFVKEMVALSNRLFLDFANTTLDMYESENTAPEALSPLIWSMNQGARNIEQRLLKGMAEYQQAYIDD
jgi:anaerobic magnesium-protoporphyrin IX monomethyl ester cyclase